jgi:hypothetical protein
MAVCCQNLPLVALSSRSASSVLVGELFKKFGLFLNTPCIQISADMYSIVDYRLCSESLYLFCTVAVRREINYEKYKRIYDVSKASITELKC